MKMKPFHMLCTLLSFLLFAHYAVAQPPHPKFNPEEYRAKMEATITKRANLTQAEAQKFYPLFHEMKEKQRNIAHKIFELKKEQPAPGTSEKEYANIVMKIRQLDVEMAEIGAAYHKRMCKEIPASKVYKAILAEDYFHRKMLSDFNGKRQGGANTSARRPTNRPREHRPRD